MFWCRPTGSRGGTRSNTAPLVPRHKTINFSNIKYNFMNFKDIKFYR